MKCKVCGTINDKTAKFCKKCGANLQEQQSQAPAKVDTVTCPYCGFKNKAGSKFCEHCGKSLLTEKVSEPVQPIEKPATVAANSTRTEQKVHKSNRNKIIFSILAVLVVAGIGFAGWKFFYPGSSGDQHPTSVANKSSQSSQASSSKPKPSKKTNESKTDLVNYSPAQAEKIFNNDFGDVSGKTAVYVAPATGDAKAFVKNDKPQRAASDIKIFVLITVYDQLNQGKLNLNDEYTLKASDKVGGTGDIQNQSTGTQLTIKALVDAMIQNSDNTAANILIRQVGGMNKVNDEIKKVGAKDTKLARMLMDTDALKKGVDNYTSASDLGKVLTKIYNHQLISKKIDDQLLQILVQNVDHSKLAKNLPDSVTVYNKTGDYVDYGVQNDAAIFEKNGKACVVVILTQDGKKAEQDTALNNFGLDIYDAFMQ